MMQMCKRLQLIHIWELRTFLLLGQRMGVLQKRLVQPFRQPLFCILFHFVYLSVSVNLHCTVPGP